jgi:hypothetical protein
MKIREALAEQLETVDSAAPVFVFIERGEPPKTSLALTRVSQAELDQFEASHDFVRKSTGIPVYKEKQSEPTTSV